MAFGRLIFRGLSAVALAAAGYAEMAAAHTQRGALGKRVDTSDRYRVTCSDPGLAVPPRLEVQVLDLRPVKPPLLIVKAEKNGVEVTSIDARDGDNKPSPLVTNNGGAGTYTVTVGKLPKPGKPDKTRRYPELYSLTYHCYTGSAHTETEIQTVQNQ